MDKVKAIFFHLGIFIISWIVPLKAYETFLNDTLLSIVSVISLYLLNFITGLLLDFYKKNHTFYYKNEMILSKPKLKTGGQFIFVLIFWSISVHVLARYNDSEFNDIGFDEIMMVKNVHYSSKTGTYMNLESDRYNLRYPLTSRFSKEDVVNQYFLVKVREGRLGLMSIKSMNKKD